MTTRSDLIARLEAAKEGSRELDAWIFCAVEYQDKKPERNLFYKNREEWGVFVTNAPAPGMTFHEARHYTTSLDAALTLVKTGGYSVMTHGPQGRIIKHDEEIGPTAYVDGVEGSGATPALALCIAALKAREARR